VVGFISLNQEVTELRSRIAISGILGVRFLPIDRLMFLTIATIVITLLLIATFCDFRTREIPDWVSVAIAATGMVAACLGGLGVNPIWVVSGGLMGMIVGWLLFHFAQFGGGDAKLIGAIGCVVGPIGLLIVLFLMALAGGVLSLIAVYRGERDYAYAPAIMAGFVGYVGFVSQV
jgi:prepilin peptidase CpaA